jgi:uncharacterized lipoprotein YmbA
VLGEQNNNYLEKALEVSNPPIELTVKIKLPKFLQQRNAVIKLDKHQLRILDKHSWAEDLSTSISNVLVNELNNKAIGVIFRPKSYRNMREVMIEIDYFGPDPEGLVLLTGHFSINNREQWQDESSKQPFNLSQQAKTKEFNQAVPVMRRLLTNLASQISQQAKEDLSL